MTTQRKLETRIVTTEQMLRIIEESAKPFDRSNVWHYAEIWNRYLGNGEHELTTHSELSESELSKIDAFLGTNVELVDLKHRAMIFLKRKGVEWEQADTIAEWMSEFYYRSGI
jgi:hypothetical protein